MCFGKIRDLFILGGDKIKTLDGYCEYDCNRNDVLLHCEDGNVILSKICEEKNESGESVVMTNIINYI